MPPTQGVLSRGEFASAVRRQFGDAVSDEDIEALAAQYDLDGNGHIDFDEFQRAFGPKESAEPRRPKKRVAINSTPEMLEPPPPPDPAMLARVGKVEQTLREKLEERYSSLRATFSALDVDRTGFIEVSEFKNVFVRCHVDVPPGHMDVLVSRFDRDGNGKVDFNEFARWMAPGYFSKR
jgi:Ca2+-binding EF-hand superfamily protein